MAVQDEAAVPPGARPRPVAEDVGERVRVQLVRTNVERGFIDFVRAHYPDPLSKDELLALMGDAAMDDPPPLPAGDWREGLAFWAVFRIFAVSTAVH